MAAGSGTRAAREDRAGSSLRDGPMSPSRGPRLPQTIRMTQPSSFEKILGQPLDQVVQLQPEQRAQVLRAAIPDLNFFFDQGRGIDRRDAPERTRALAGSLFAALATDSDTEGARVSEA